MAHCFIWKQAHTHTQYCITLQSLSGSGTGCRIREVTGDNLTSACHETGFKHWINRITTAKQKRCVMLPLVACQFAVVVPTPVYCAYCMSVVSPVGSFDSSSCCSLLRQFVFWHELSWFSRLFPPEWHCECFLFILTSSPAVPADILCPILELHQVSHITLKILTCRWLEIYYSDRYCSRSAFSYVLWLCCRGLMWSLKEKTDSLWINEL